MIIRKLIATVTAAAVASTLTAGVAHAVSFGGTYNVQAHDSDPGLVIQVGPQSGSFAFDLNNPGDTAWVNLFDIWTNEGDVGGDDIIAQSITVDFDFTLPTSFGGTVTGETVGESDWGWEWIFLVNKQSGNLTWLTSPLELEFGNGGLLSVALNDATFNKGLYGLDEGYADGATVKAKFKLLEAPTPVPVPAALPLLASALGCLGLLGWTRRRAVA